MPVLVMAIYAALVVWAALLIMGLRHQSYRPFPSFGVGLTYL